MGLSWHLQILIFLQVFFKVFLGHSSVSFWGLLISFLEYIGLEKLLYLLLGFFGFRVLFPYVVWDTIHDFKVFQGPICMIKRRYPMIVMHVLLLKNIRQSTSRELWQSLNCHNYMYMIEQVYIDEARPHNLNKLTFSFQLMMNFSEQVAHKNAFVLKDSIILMHHIVLWALHLLIPLSWNKRGNNTLVLGNGYQVPMDGHIKVHVKIQQYHSQINCLASNLSHDTILILGNNWLVQHMAPLDVSLNVVCLLRAIVK